EPHAIAVRPARARRRVRRPRPLRSRKRASPRRSPMNPTRPNDIFTRDELARLTARSDVMGFWAVLSTWAVIAGAFALVARWPNPFTVVLAVLVLGGRQLALTILMHEGAHRTLFRTRWLNDVVVDAACARPVWGDLAKYRTHHLVHHR